MSVERLKHIQEILLGVVEGQMYNLEEVDAKELGEVVDIIKDIDEAIYYCAVTKAMEEGKEREEKESKYYTPMYYTPTHQNGRMMYYEDRNGSWNGGQSSSHYSEMNNTDGRDNRRYYNGNGSSGSGGSNSSSGGNGNSGGSSQYSEKEFPHAFQDVREGKSPHSRRMYMEAKETKQDKATQMKELERYMQELAQDIIEMVEGSSPEERQYMSKKVSALATKLSQLNG